MSKGLTTREYLSAKDSVEEVLSKFYELIAWTEDDYKEYENLLRNLKDSYKKCKKDTKEKATTKSKGNILEDIVDFIIKKSYFLEVYPNKRTATNEIDQLVVMSDRGKQALYMFDITKKLLNLEGDFFLGECKNYDGEVNVTWVGKFNTLLKVCGDCKLGIIFSYDGLTGDENKWYAAHGLTKVIYKVSSEEYRKYIIDFNIKEFESLRDRNNNFFKLLGAKKLALSTGCKSEKLYDFNEGQEEMENIYNNMISGEKKEKN